MTAVLRGRAPDLALAALGIGLGAVGGLLSSYGAQVVGVFTAACLLLALVLTRPVLVGVMALSVGSFTVQRFGGAPGSGTGVSYADLLLAAATALALPSLAAGPELRRLRLSFIGLGVYMACLLPTVLFDDSSRGWFEWSHRLVLVGGAMLVGAWIAREGQARHAIRALTALACLLALLAVADCLRQGLEPADPLGLHKNFVGAQLSIVFVVVVAARREITGLHRSSRSVAVLVLAAGLLASQSRGAMLAATAGILMAVAFSPRAQGKQARSLVVLLSMVLLAGVFFSLRADLSQDDSDLANSSIGVRQQVERRTLEIWRTSPVTGVGLKYFNSGEWGRLAQPANIVVDNELAESGVLGLSGFAVLQLLVVVAGITRRRDPFVLVGTACVVAALVHGMVDIYWTAATVSLPFLLLGVGLGGGAEAQPPAKIKESALSRT